jgi:hypothetical protein
LKLITIVAILYEGYQPNANRNNIGFRPAM